MNIGKFWAVVAFPIVFGLNSCGGGGGSTTGSSQVPSPDPGSGFVTVGITDGPTEEVRSLVLNIAHLELGHVDGSVTRIAMGDGPIDLDLMSLQNGTTHELVNRARIPVGQYEWMRLGVDLDNSYLETMGLGGRHGMNMMSHEGLMVHQPFFVSDAEHLRLILDFDLRLALRQRQMGMMGDRWELHPAMRLMEMNDAGGLAGRVSLALVDANNPACDPAEGGNWVYLFVGGESMPDDLSETEIDGIPGPYAADRVELHPGRGEFRYHFAFLPEGAYRVAFTCSGEWDEQGDDDYPVDPDGRFDFHAVSEPVEIVAGEITVLDIGI